MTEVDISCLCGKVQRTLQVTATLPTSLKLCHRGSCRYNLGSLCHATLPLNEHPKEVELLLRKYDCEETSRYFCPNCGSHLFEQSKSGWKVQSGVMVQIHSEQVFGCFDTLSTSPSHQYVEETIDGGLSVCLTGAEATRTTAADPSWSTTRRTQSAELNVVDSRSNDAEGNPVQLRASCVCGGVQFFITRPDKSSTNCSSPWPDLIVPYHSTSPDNPDDVKWWVRDNKTKWLAGTCACKSCRLGLGFSIQSWAFVSLANLQAVDGSPFSYNTGTLTSYESSEGAMREFCGICGATAFWHNSERPGVVDVSVGLFRADEGVMARTWLRWWTDRVSFAEDALEQRFVASLQNGLKILKRE